MNSDAFEHNEEKQYAGGNDEFVYECNRKKNSQRDPEIV